MADVDPWLILPAAILVSFAWRALGVAVSGRIDPDSALFEWVRCVAFALLAGLVSRMLIFPGGVLAESELLHRLVAMVVAFAVYYLARRRLLVGLVAGIGVFIALEAVLNAA